MEPTQNLSDFFSNNAQGSGGSPGTSLSGFLDTPAKPTATQGRVSDVSSIIAQEGADHLKPVIEAIYKQESGAGSNARTSIDGAHGGMQIIPATFQRYAKPGERIDNPDDNMRVGVRIIKDLARRFGNDPAKIATGYFSGEGNVNPGQGSAWKNDRADGNGKRVSGYVADILAKVGGISEAQAAQPATTAPDLTKAPKWADIAGKPEFTSLPAEKQAEAKAAYFDYYIAPHAGQQAAALRQQFMQSPTSAPDRTWGEAAGDTGVQLAEGVNTILGAIPNLVSPEGDVAGFFNNNAQFWRDKQSKTLQGKIANADKAITKAGEDGVISQIAEAASQYFTDPALAARFVTTNLPSMIPGIGAAKLAQAAALAKGASAARAAQLATTAAGATNAALNAGGARGEAFEDIKRTLIQQGMSPEQAEQQALADSRIVAAVGGIAGYVSGKTGLEKSLFGQATTKGAIKSGVAATATELAGEQLEEVAPKITTNIQAGQYDNRSVGQDVGRTIVETAIGSGPGALVAGGASAMQKAPETATVTPDGRIEPTMGGETPVQAAEPAPVDVHPTVQAADAIVRDLATEANIPLETVLPTQPQPTTGPELVSDQDVQAFADGRYQQLRAKRDGQIETTVGESGIVDQDVPGAGLTAAEQQELAGLEQARGDVVTLRTLYGIDQPVPSDQSQLAAQGNEAVPEAAPVAQPTPGQQFTATTETGLLAAQEGQSENGQDPQLGAAQYQDAGNGIAAEQRAAPVAEPAADPAIAQAPAVDAAPAQQVQPETAVTESEANREARLEREAIQAEGEPMPETPRQYADIPFPDDSASPATTAANPFEDAAPAKPRTEKEARAQRDYAGKWFGSQEKAEQFIAKQGIGATHVAIQDGKKFLIQKKEISNAHQAAQAQQAEAQGSERQQAPSATEVGQPAPKTEKEARGAHYAAGESAFKEGKPRELPSYFTNKTGKNAKEWYRGWDAANQQAVPDANNSEKNSTNSNELTLEKQGDEGQNGSKENASDANPVQPEPVSSGTAAEDQQDVADGHRDRQPVDAGLAADSQGLDSDRGVSGRPEDSGEGGSQGEAGTGSESSVELGKSTGVRPESGAADTDDHVIDAGEIGKGGLGQKYRDNVAAIKIIKALETEGRNATPEERKALAKYVGWGAMKGPFDPENKAWAKQHAELKELLTAEEFRTARASTLDAHYTSPVAVGAMYEALARLGVKSGRVLEPSVGVGNFFGLMPREMRNASQLHGVELDSLTSRLVAALYPKAKIAKATGFQDFEIPSEYFDVVIGNPPFGSHPLVDKERSPYSGFSIHNYFLAKSIDKLRPGGVMAIVVSHNFLDAQDARVRKWIGDRASLIGGVRLPNTAFKENAGTEVVTDILIFQKHDKNGLPGSIAPWQDVVEQININPKTGEHVTHKVNQFFVANPQHVLGKPSAGGTMYSANEYTVEQDGNIKDALAKWVKTLPENVFDNIDRARDSAVVDMAVPDGVKVGSYYVDANGAVMRRGDDLMGEKTAVAWEPRYESQVGRMRGMIAIRDALRQQMRLERSLDATEQTYDTRRWQILEHKARGIEQLRNYDGTLNEIDDIEGEAANAADMKAAASGDPLILEETKLRNDVRRLEQLQAGHADEVLAMTRKARDAQEYADTHGPASVREIKELLGTTAKHPVDKDGLAPISVQGGKALTDKESAHKALASVFENVRSHMIDTASIQYRGLTFKLEHFAGNVIMRTPTGNGGAWSATDPFSPSGMVQRLKNYIDRLPAVQDETQARIEKSKKDAASMRELAKQPFPQAKELEAAREAHKQVQRALMAKGPEVPENQKAAVATGIEQQKAKLRELGFGDALDEFFDSGSTPTVMSATGEAEALPESEWLSEGAFAQVIQDRTMQFRHQPPILIRDSVIDVPHMRNARAGGMAGAVSGGKIYLFRDANATTADVVQTLWHELVHYGLRRFLTKEQYIAQMQKLYDRDLWVQKRAEEWLATDGDDVKQARKAGEAYARARGVDEALAELAETNEGEYRNNALKAKAIRQAARWIAAVAERFGFNEFAAKYRAVTNDEARALVRSMFQKLREDAPATSSDWAFTADPAFMVRRIQNNLIQFFGNRNETLKTFGKYDKTLSTQYNKALKDKNYGKVFAYVNAMQNEVSLTSIRPAELAPGVLPRVDDVKSALRGLVKGKHADKNLTQAADAIFAGTLNGPNVMAGKVWSDDELRGKFGLTDTGIALYRQARAAIDASLDEVAASEAYAMAQGIVPKAMRRSIIDNPRLAESLLVGELQKQIKLLDMAIKNAKRQGNEQQQSEYEAIRAQYADTKRKVEKIFVTGKNLKLAGYAPLMRFGKWTVTVQQIDPTTGNVLRDDDGKPLTEYFGKFETEGEAISVRHQMEAKYKDRDDIKVKAGVDSQAAHELYAGISPETIALFGEAVGADEVTRKYYQMALSERSALKRRLERKGTAGYSEDLPRVLSNFITSNGRFAAQRYYLRDLNNAIKYIPQEKGDVKDEAMRLKQFVMNPNDPAAPVSSVMFAWFLGGSVAAALVNMTQPVMMTGPYLSQHGVTTASKALAKAIPYAMGKKEITDAELKAALKRASQEGIVDAQEIFHLYSVGAQGVASGLVNTLARLPGVGGTIKAGSEDARARINAFLTLWGSMFSLAEGFNRRLTFIAAWDVAVGKGESNPYAFAVRAVNETQGIYNKVNRPNWAQGKVGRVILTFKQFSLMYIELLSRMWKRGGPEGKRAALIMLAMLMLASGEEGLPFAQDLDDLIDTIGQMFGLDTNMRRNKRRLAHEILGKTLGDLFLYGVSAQLPIDLSGRLGLGNMIPGTGVLKPSDEQMRGRNVAEIFGPTAGMATQIGDAYDAATEGNPGKALQNLAPKAIKDLMAAAEMSKKGYATDAKGRKVVDVGLEDVASKAVGFNPTKVAQQHRKTMPIQQDIALQKRTETAIVDQWARGVADGDEEMVDAAIKRRDDWNRLNPRTPIVIRGTQIRDRVRQMATEKDDRLLRQAPKEMRGAIGLDLVDAE